MAKCVPPCPGRFPVSRVCSTTSRVDFWECVPPCSESISGRRSVFRHILVNCWSAKYVLPHPRSISGCQSVFRHVMVNYWSAKCVLPRPRSISSRPSVFRHIPGQFPVGRVCSGASLVDFRMVECIPPRPGQFPVGRVCSAMSWVDFQSAEYFLSIRISSD